MGRASAEIDAEIARFGSIGFDRYVELALYGEHGFFTAGRGAGRAGRDFVTSPEIGPLFGRCVAVALDDEWRALGSPDPFVVVEAGAGNGRLCREVLRAEPACAPALRYVLVETSAMLRAEQHERLTIEPPAVALGGFAATIDDEPPEPVERLGPIVTALDALPAIAIDGVVLANELLDNLPFGLAEYDGTAWHELRVGSGRAWIRVPLARADASAVGIFGSVPPGTRVSLPRALGPWLAAAAALVRRGALLLVDYMIDAAAMSSRGDGWLRTYRDHQRGGDPLTDPGSHDITADVVVEQLIGTAASLGLDTALVGQAEWLRKLGIDQLVDDGARRWSEGAGVGDLRALEGRSRATQAAALTDPDGLGGFTVARLVRR